MSALATCSKCNKKYEFDLSNPQVICPDCRSSKDNKSKKEAKYHAEPAYHNGIRYASTLERDFAQNLDLLLRGGEILWWSQQAQFVVAESIVYQTDFIYVDKCGKIFVVDTKGMKTKDYLIKRKMLLTRFPNLAFFEFTDGQLKQVHIKRKA